MVSINVMSLSLEGKFMKRFHNEHGFAMIEILLVISIIAVISSIALPNVINSFKTVYVNHEMLNLYSEMRFLQNANRLCIYNQEDVFHYLTPNAINQEMATFSIKSNNKNKYHLIMVSKNLSEHRLSPNFSFENDFNIYMNNSKNTTTIHNSRAPNSVSFTLKMKNNENICNPVIIVDSVGRIRIGNN